MGKGHSGYSGEKGQACVWHVTILPHLGSDRVGLEPLRGAFPRSRARAGSEGSPGQLPGSSGRWGWEGRRQEGWAFSKVLRRGRPDSLHWWPPPAGRAYSSSGWSQHPSGCRTLSGHSRPGCNLLGVPFPSGPLPEKTSQRVSDDTGSNRGLLPPPSQSPKVKTTINYTKSEHLLSIYYVLAVSLNPITMLEWHHAHLAKVTQPIESSRF